VEPRKRLFLYEILVQGGSTVTDVLDKSKGYTIPELSEDYFSEAKLRFTLEEAKASLQNYIDANLTIANRSHHTLFWILGLQLALIGTGASMLSQLQTSFSKMLLINCLWSFATALILFSIVVPVYQNIQQRKGASIGLQPRILITEEMFSAKDKDFVLGCISTYQDHIDLEEAYNHEASRRLRHAYQLALTVILFIFFGYLASLLLLGF
jgi:hypothetical protein